MKNITVSAHAIKRGQQRGIKKDHVLSIIKFGEKVRKPGNAFEIWINKKRVKKMAREERQYCQQFDKLINKAILMDKSLETVITVYNRTA